MRQTNHKRRIVKGTKPARTVRINVRLTEEEYGKLRVLMTNLAYRSISNYLRDVLFKKRIVSKREVVRLTDRTLRDHINAVAFQIRKIGANYNQVVALYHTQAKMTCKDGTPWLDTNKLDAKIEELMSMTEELRNELAVLIDTVERYTMEN